MKLLNTHEIELVTGAGLEAGPNPNVKRVEDEEDIIVVTGRKFATSADDSYARGRYIDLICQTLTIAVGIPDLNRDIFCNTNYTGDNPQDPANRDRVNEILAKALPEGAKQRIDQAEDYLNSKMH